MRPLPKNQPRIVRMRALKNKWSANRIDSSGFGSPETIQVRNVDVIEYRD